MLRRQVVAGLLAGLTLTPGAVSAQAVFRTAIDVGVGDPEAMNRALNIALELGRYHMVRRETAEIRIVTHGPGLDMIRLDRSPVMKRVEFVGRSIPTIAWVASVRTINEVTQSEGAPPPLPPTTIRVADGPEEIARLRASGWSVLQP